MPDKNFLKREVSVGVIIPCFNSSATIARCLDSICKQTVRVKYIFIYDDGSSDLEILKQIIDSYNSILNIKFYSCKINHGPSTSRNYFLGDSDVKYFAFLDSDDVWLTNKVEVQYNFMEANNACLSGHGYLPILNNSIKNDIHIKYYKLSVNDFIFKSPLFTPTIMIRNLRIRPFNYNFKSSEDWLFCLENIIFNSWENQCYYIDNIMAGGFKLPLGVSGAGSSIIKCHFDRLRALKYLYSNRIITSLDFFSAFAYEKIKFPLRYIKHFKLGRRIYE